MRSFDGVKFKVQVALKYHYVLVEENSKWRQIHSKKIRKIDY